MNKVPIFILVPGILIIGIILIVYFQKPHTPCDSQREIFMESQRGYLFTREVKGVVRPPQYNQFFSQCQASETPGSCYEFFALMRKVVRDLQSAPVNCLIEFAELNPLKAGLGKAIKEITAIAWGSQSPTEGGTTKYGWLTSSDLSLFCSLRRAYEEIYGQEALYELQTKIMSELPGEPMTFNSSGECLNCDTRKTALEISSREEVWAKTIMSVRCSQF
jgi:hypothetical protein